MKEVLVISLALFLIVDVLSVENITAKEWKAFKDKFNRRYKNAEEEEMRMKRYMRYKQEVTEHNLRYKWGEELYSREMDEWADMTSEEIRTTYTPSPPRGTRKARIGLKW